MTAFPQPMVTSVDAYPNAPPDAAGSWDSYRPPMGIDPPSRPYEGERYNIGGPRGVNLHEAKQLYRQVYQSSGAGRDMFSPLELGHAAAYHAYRTSIRSRPLQGDIELERENLIGLAVAEASRLSHQSSRDFNINTFTATSEAAARTACRIFTQACGTLDNEFIARPSYTTNPYTNYPESEDFEMVQRPPSRAVRGRSLSRGPRPTFADSATVVPDMVPGQTADRIPLNSSYSGAPFHGPRYPPTPYPSNTRHPTMPQTFPSYSPTLYNNPGTMVNSYPRTAPMSNAVLPQAYQVQSYSESGSMVPVSRHFGASSSSLPVHMAPSTQASYAGNMPYGYSATQPPQTIIIHQPKKHRHRHHHHRHHRRSMSR